MQTPIYTVSQLNAEVKSLLEDRFAPLSLLGEVSNLIQSQAGHLYFSLKDGKAQVRCAIFRQSASRLKLTPSNGQQLLVQGKVSFYETRGDFQLIINQVEAAGDGALQMAFEQLKKKLAAAGLFDPERKQALPRYPKTIGVITSPTGAAIRDILKVLKRRCPSITVIVYPSLVQGEQAAAQIAQAIAIANQRAECDALILARGGGSIEDLWAFNEEIVAGAIADSQLPIVSGIGHEIDFTIADFVADQRAPTPSAAAEQISPDQREWQQHLQQAGSALWRVIRAQLDARVQQLLTLKQRLRHPQQQLDQYQQRLTQLSHQLQFACQQQRHHKQQALKALAEKLNAINPLNTLQRGYAIVTDSQKHVITDSHQVRENDALELRLAQGKLHCRVEKMG